MEGLSCRPWVGQEVGELGFEKLSEKKSVRLMMELTFALSVTQRNFRVLL